MAAYFRIVENPTHNKEEKPSYHVRFSANGTLSTDDLMEEITYGTTYTDSDVDGLLSLLQHLLHRKLASGYNVRLDGIGTFSLSLDCPPGLEKPAIGYHNVKVRGIRFRPSGELLNRLADTTFYRRKERKHRCYTLEERREFLLDHLATGYHITCSYYSQKMFISKTTGSKDLNQFEQEGLIVREGKGPTTFYRLRK